MTKFYCANCGKHESTAKTLLSYKCERHPDGACKGYHVLYEGGEKSKYTCKYCGKTASSIRQLTGIPCQRHPKGPSKGYCVPAL